LTIARTSMPVTAARVAKRPFLIRLGWTLRDYTKRVWDNSGEDNVLFLAGGIAFNLILAAVPFILLLVTGATYLLPIFVHDPSAVGADQVYRLMDHLLPAHNHGDSSSLDKLIQEIVRTRGSVGSYSAIGFVWFSTRLFGSLRTVLASVFDIESERGIIAGKIFDVKITIVSTLLFVGYLLLTTYATLATKNGGAALVDLGLRKDVMRGMVYWLDRTLAFAFVLLMFFALYKYLPIRRVRAKTAWFASLFTSVAFEAARTIFSVYTSTFNPASLYSGTLAAIIIVVFWVYYAALIFILGGEVGQVYELRRVRRLQREVFET
jgi:membrane protein